MINISCNTALRGWGFLDAIITLCPKCHRTINIVNMSDERTDQSMRTTMFLKILVRCVLTLSS